ncbi:MAG: hypothetical protein EB127_14180 [Alphaproteobacteria bacterium]|nr:hypothetical protein [Alphaproteobacteria bacterium]
MSDKYYVERRLWAYHDRKYINPPRLQQPPMILPKINSLTGHYIPEKPSIHDQMNYRYSLYSKAYWEGVRERQREYRIKMSNQSS